MKKGQDINLLVAAKEPEIGVQVYPVVKVAVILLIIVYILIVIVVFSFYFIFSQREKRITREIKSKEIEIGRFVKDESLQLAVKSRLDALSWIFGKEKDKVGCADAIQRIKNLTDDKVTINSLEITDFGSSVTLAASASKITDLISFLIDLVRVEGKDSGFDNLAVSSLSKNEQGYNFNINLAVSH